MGVDEESWRAAVGAARAWVIRNTPWRCDECNDEGLCIAHARLALGAADADALRAVQTDPEIIEALGKCFKCTFTIGNESPHECPDHEGTTLRIRMAWRLPYTEDTEDGIDPADLSWDGATLHPIGAAVGAKMLSGTFVPWDEPDADPLGDVLAVADAMKKSPATVTLHGSTIRSDGSGKVSMFDGTSWVEIGTVDSTGIRIGKDTTVGAGSSSSGFVSGASFVGVGAPAVPDPSVTWTTLTPSTGTLVLGGPGLWPPEPPEPPKPAQVNVRMPHELRERLKMLAVRQSRTVQDLVNEMVERAVGLEETTRERTATSTRVEIGVALVRSPSAVDLVDLMKLLANVAHAKGWQVERIDADDASDDPPF